MKIALIAFGKLKTPGLRDASDYYQKLIRPWVPLEEIELKPVPVTEKNPALRQQIQDKEALILDDKLRGILSSRGAFYLLDEGGKTLNTRQWAELVRDWQNQSVPEVAFCLGSSMGFGEPIRKRARGILSLGPQTLSHELARVVLLEQLYRAWSVVRGHPYHNEG